MYVYSLVARRRKIYDTRATLQKEASNYSYTKSNGYTSGSGYRYRTRADPKRDYNYNYNDDEYSRPDNNSTKHGNRYHSFTFRNLFEWTPFHKLFGKNRTTHYVACFLAFGTYVCSLIFVN